MVTIYIASKTNDIYQIPLKHVYNDIGHKKFSFKDIREKEFEILSKFMEIRCFKL